MKLPPAIIVFRAVITAITIAILLLLTIKAIEVRFGTVQVQLTTVHPGAAPVSGQLHGRAGAPGLGVLSI